MSRHGRRNEQTYEAVPVVESPAEDVAVAVPEVEVAVVEQPLGVADFVRKAIAEAKATRPVSMYWLVPRAMSQGWEPPPNVVRDRLHGVIFDAIDGRTDMFDFYGPHTPNGRLVALK